MTKLHKDIIFHLMQCVQNESLSDNAIVKVLYFYADVNVNKL